MTTLSIALATYNGARFLPEQLDSLTRQTRLPDELLIADDSSTDRTLQIVQDFARRAPFRTVLLPPVGRLGYRANFMRCAEHCSGELIAFCDQDDVWDAEKLATVEDAIEPTTLLLQHDFRVVDGELALMPSNGTTIGAVDDPRWSPVLGLVQVFRRSLLATWPLWPLSADHNEPSQRMAHDQWVYFMAQALGGVQMLHQPLLSYRQHGGNTCGIKDEEIPETELRVGAVAIGLLCGRPQRLGFKKGLIVEGLSRRGPAARSRATILSAMMRDEIWVGASARLREEQLFYAGLAAYYEKRLDAYRSRSWLGLVTSLAGSRPYYLSRGWRGMKDLILDAAINV